MSWPTVSLVLHCFQFDAKLLFSFLFFSASVVALAAVRGDRGSIWLEMGVYEGVCLGISLSVRFEYLSFETMISSYTLIFL